MSDGRGAVYADFDNDGDPDIFLPTVQGPAHLLFRNDIGQRNGWIRVSLVGSASGRDAYGATVRVKTSQGVQTKIKSGGEGFLSQHDPRLLFGLGSDAAAEWIEVSWPSGKLQRVDGPVTARTHLSLDEATSSATVTASSPNTALGGSGGTEVAAMTSHEKRLVLTGETVHGERTRLTLQHRTLVVLWATWCSMCREDLDTLVRSRAALASEGYDIIAASVDEDRAAFDAFVSRRKLPLHVIRLTAESRTELFRGRDNNLPAALTTQAEGKPEQWLVGRSAVLRLINASTLIAKKRKQK